MKPHACAGIIVITGSPASGKSRLLSEWVGRLRRKKWQVCGIETVPGTARLRGSNTTAPQYHIRIIGTSQVLPWAVLSEPKNGETTDETGRLFPESTRAAVIKKVLPVLPNADVCVLEDLGLQELSGRGFGQLLNAALDVDGLWIVATVKKSFLADISAGFQGMRLIVVDLDETTNPRDVFDFLAAELETRLAARIGACAGLGGLVEVGLGSLLHTLHVPLKGHVLAYIQTLLLITFGRQLRGRGLFRITMLMAMLKAFSPAGKTIRPMLYIFLQGSSFALPVLLFGWNLFSAILGSILLNGVTLFVSMLANYLLFGESILAALGNLAGIAGNLLGISIHSWTGGLLFLFLVKTWLAAAVSITGYYFHLAPKIFSFGYKARSVLRAPAPVGPQNAWQSVKGALGDLLRPFFLLAFGLSILVILFFANISSSQALFAAVRGLCIAFAGFWLFRRISVEKIGNKLQKRFSGPMAVALAEAVRVLQDDKKNPLSKER